MGPRIHLHEFDAHDEVSGWHVVPTFQPVLTARQLPGRTRGWGLLCWPVGNAVSRGT